MSTSILSLILWIPYLLVVLIAGLIYGISGYKKGPWCALIELGTTIVAAVVSMLLSNQLASWIAPGISAALISSLRDPASGGLTATVVEYVLQYVFSLLLFVFLLFVLNILFHAISRRFTKTLQRSGRPAMKLSGLAIGLACALIYSLLFWMPLYGSLATYVPAAEQLLSMMGQDTDDDALSPYIACVVRHPVVQISGSGPMASLYQGTTQLQTQKGSTLNIAQIAQTLDKAMTYFHRIKDAEEAQIPDLCEEFLEFLRDNVVNEPWSYGIVMELASRIEDMVAQSEDLEEQGSVTGNSGTSAMPAPTNFLDPASARLVSEKLLPILDIDQETFQENACALLDYGILLLKKDGISILDNNDLDAMAKSGLLLEAGKLANLTVQAIQVKQIIWIRVLFQISQDPLECMAIADRYPLPQLTESAALEQEAQALMLGMGFAPATPAEFILRHPSLGEPVLEELSKTYSHSLLFGLDEDDALSQWLGETPSAQQVFLEQARTCAAQPLGTTSFADYCSFARDFFRYAQTGDSYFHYTYDPMLLSFALEALGPEVFTSGSLAAGAQIYSFFNCFAQLPAAESIAPYENPIDSICSLGFVMDRIVRGEITQDYTNDLIYRLSSAYCSDAVIATMEKLVETSGNDPLNLSSYYTGDTRQVLLELLATLKDGSGFYGGAFSSSFTIPPDISASGPNQFFVGDGVISYIEKDTVLSEGGSGDTSVNVIIGSNGSSGVIIGGESALIDPSTGNITGVMIGELPDGSSSGKLPTGPVWESAYTEEARYDWFLRFFGLS